MADYAPGDRVHIAAVGSGVVREVRNGGRYLVEVKGRSIVVDATQLVAAAAPKRGRPRGQVETAPDDDRLTLTLDLHGSTAVAAIDLLEAFINEALLAGATEARIIHGRSGGTLKAAVHRRMKGWPGLKGFALDPRNPGVTIIRF